TGAPTGTGAPAGTGGPSAISGAPAGTTGTGPGATTGTPDMSVMGALDVHTGAAAGPPGPAGPLANRPPAPRPPPAAPPPRPGPCRPPGRGPPSFARLALDARIAAGFQRGGRRVRAQRQGGPAQPSDGTYFDVEPIEDRHRRRLLALSISALKWSTGPHA